MGGAVLKRLRRHEKGVLGRCVRYLPWRKDMALKLRYAKTVVY
jgi:hypothetical protein